MREDDDTSPHIQTKIARKDYDRLLTIAASLGRTSYSILQDLVHEFCENFLAVHTDLDDDLKRLQALRRTLEAGYTSAMGNLMAREVAKDGSAKDPDPIARAFKAFVAKANTGDDRSIGEAVEDLRREPERVRLAVHGRLATSLPDLWERARPHIAGIPRYPRTETGVPPK
jgi:hypothetical protein